MQWLKDRLQLVKRIKWVQVSVALMFILVVMWGLSEEQNVTSQQSQTMPVLNVTTVTARPAPYRVSESVVGITQARWPLQVVSAVEGRVKVLNQELEPGDRVDRDTLLLALDDVPYQAELSSATAQIKQAELELARYQHEQTVAEKVSGPGKLSSFGRYEPHIQAAKANLNAAVIISKQAAQRLKETEFRPPFDAIVVEKKVVPGQWVNVGDELFTLIASSSIDIHAELSPQQLSNLGALENATKLSVTDSSGKTWPARLRHVVPTQSGATRQTQVVFFVEDAFSTHHSLLPNSMVTIDIHGHTTDNVVEAPATVITPDGYVWVVNEKRLQKAQITLQDALDDKVWFQFVEQPAAQRELIRYPTSTMLAGQKVTTQQAAEHGVSQ